MASPTSDRTITNHFDPPGGRVFGRRAELRGTLPFTGSGPAGLLKAAFWLLVVGFALYFATRERRRDSINS